MRTTRPIIPLAVLIAMSAAFTACGDDASAETLTESQFVDQVNALCTAEGQAIGAIVGPIFASAAPSADAQQAALDQIVQLSTGLNNDIDALAAPDSLTTDVDQLTASLIHGTDTAAAQTGEEFFASDDDPWADAVAKAHEMGLDACGNEDG